MNVNKYHILFVSTWFPNKISKLSGDFVQRHAKAVSTLHQVSVLHVEGDDNTKAYHIETAQLNPNYQEIIVFYPKSRFSIINAYRKFKAYQKGAKNIASYDLIHANVMYYNLFWAWTQSIFRNKPMVISEHSTAFYSHLNWLRKTWNKMLGNSAAVIMPVSIKLKEAMQQQGINAKYKVIPNVVNTELFGTKKSQKHTTFQFLHISMLLDSHKNISGQLEAVKILAEQGYDFEFHIGGNGDLKPIHDFIKQHHLYNYIKTFGTLSHAEVAKKMKDADVFILFSHKENQPCVIIESFSVGTPVIASDVGGISEYFPPGFGKIVPSNDITALVKAMKTVLDNPSHAAPEEMHQYAQENFSIPSIAHQFDQIYQSIIRDL